VVTLTLFVAVGIAGIVDHHLKTKRMNRAEVSEWFCKHEQARCGGPSSQRIEDAWNERERGYLIALGVIAVAGATFIVVGPSNRH